jgi:hypothetical protein
MPLETLLPKVKGNDSREKNIAQNEKVPNIVRGV